MDLLHIINNKLLVKINKSQPLLTRNEIIWKNKTSTTFSVTFFKALSFLSKKF